MKFMAWTMIGCATFGLAACQSKISDVNQPQFLTQKIYHAPAQSYDFDLGSPLLRGELKLKEACSVTGSSLDIQDQIQQQLRIDTLNLDHHPQLGQQLESDLKTIAPAILNLYETQYQSKAQQPKIYQSHIGDVVITRLQHQNNPIDLLIVKKYQYAYVLQFNSALPVATEEISRQRMLNLLKSLQIPGKHLAGSSSTLPLSFDLSNGDASARRTWQKTYCS